MATLDGMIWVLDDKVVNQVEQHRRLLTTAAEDQEPGHLIGASAAPVTSSTSRTLLRPPHAHRNLGPGRLCASTAAMAAHHNALFCRETLMQ